MNILWFSWKDICHPHAGGAERVGHGWRRGLAADGHDVRHVTARHGRSPRRERIDGIETIRCGRTRVTHYPGALAYYLRHGRDWADCIVEEVNTIPYLIGAAGGRGQVVLLYHQLAREIWFYQTPLPIAIAGYAAESVYTRGQSRLRLPVLTVSPDSRRDLCALGFRHEDVRIVREAIENPPLDTYDPAAKDPRFTVLFHGSLRAMKRPLDALRAFARILDIDAAAHLWVSGAGDDGPLRRYAEQHRFGDRVTFFGRTSEAQKLDLMRRASVLVATSVKEGWGLVVTEANSMATPALVYDVDGLRSSAGPHNVITAPAPDALGAALHEARRTFLDRERYDRWCRSVLDDSREYTPDASYRDFERALMDAVHQ